MQLIKLAICINNKDPKGLNRIRYVDYTDTVGAKESFRKYEEWDDNDPFVAGPFLPTNINHLPEEQQAVRIIRYNTEKTTVNAEYIAGPFSTNYDFESQTFSQQISSTTYGQATKQKKDILNKDGELPPDSKNAFAKNKHFGIDGKYGSDVIFTDNGVVLRGGKLLTKESATQKERKKIADFPIVAQKVAKLQLKKFPQKKVSVNEKTNRTVYENATLKFIIEYSVNSINSPTTLNFYVRQVTSQYEYLLKSNSFTEFTVIPSGTTYLLNIDDTTTTPTWSYDLTQIPDFTSSSISEKINDICSEIRTKLLSIQSEGLKDVMPIKVEQKFSNPEKDLKDIYPFFFRPTSEFRNRTTSNDTEKTRKQTILSGVKLSGNGPTESGLVWSQTQFNSPSNVVTDEITKLKTDTGTREQTFASLVGDRLYLLSMDTNFTGEPIDFTKLDSYEYTQDDYLNKIDPNTYALVRGEVLLGFLRAMYNVLTSHVHNINKPYARGDYDAHNIMEDLFNKLENDLLNKSIRTN
jgi:hypothetical protein